MTAGLNNRPKEWSRPPEPTCRTRDVGAAATSGDRHRLRLSRRGSTRWPLARSREDRMRDPLVAYAGDLPSERIARLEQRTDKLNRRARRSVIDGPLHIGGIAPVNEMIFTPANKRGAGAFDARQRERDRKFADSPLEGNGIELPVPVRQAKLTRSYPTPDRRASLVLLGEPTAGAGPKAPRTTRAARLMRSVPSDQHDINPTFSIAN